MAEESLRPEALLELARELIRIPSVNPVLAPAEGTGEAAVAAFACQWLNARGVPARLEEAAPGRPNVVAEIESEPGPTLVLCAHLDTVGVAGMTDPPFDPVFEGGRLHGRGSYDMKGAAAAVMAAGAAVASRPFRGRLLLALVADEEYASLGAEHFVRHHRADACILTEPSELDLVLAHKGFVWSRVTTEGRAAHGSRWDLGVSAIGRMGRIVAALEEFDRSRLRRRTHPLVGPASMHCAMIEGGAGLSTYAPECRLDTERRTLPGETPEQVLEELRAVIRSAGEEARVENRFHRPPMSCEPEAAIARCVREAARGVTGAVPRDAGASFWMDAAIFAQAGIPTVDYGPAGAGAHAAAEWVDVDSLAVCARVLCQSMRTLHRHLEETPGIRS